MISRTLLLIFFNLVVMSITNAEDKLSPEKQRKLDALIGKMAKKQANEKTERRKFLEANLGWIKNMSANFKEVSKHTAKAESGDPDAIEELKTLEKKIREGFDSQPLPPQGDSQMSDLASDTASAFNDGHIGLKGIISALEEKSSARREIATERAARYMNSGGKKLINVRKRTEKMLNE